MSAPLLWLLLGVLVGALMWPYQVLSELGFLLQRRLWPLSDHGPAGALLVFVASFLTIWLAWGPLAGGRGGGLTPVLALQRNGVGASDSAALLARFDLRTQLRRLPLMLLTHLGGLTVGVESPSAALGASLLLAVRQRWPSFTPLAALPLPWLTAIGAGAGLGAAFRSPLLGAAYAIEELNREQGNALVLPTLLVAGSGALVSTRLGQPARLEGLELGPLDPHLWAWALLITAVAAALGSLFVRLLITLAAVVSRGLLRRRSLLALLLALLLTLLAVLSSGLSLNDGSLSLAASLQGLPGGSSLTLLWRFLASLLSIAAAAPGGLMHDAMSLGGLLVVPLQGLPGLISLPEGAWAQLAAVGATAVFAAANGTPLFCALFVFTLQGDPQLLPVLLIASALSVWLAQRWRGPTWNETQVDGLEASLNRAAC
jgi:H+/Cl- antiporter ClcA